MLKHNLLLIYRNFKRFKSTFIINLVGLSTGMACVLLIYLWVNDELTIDRFHDNESRIYQILTNQHQTSQIVTLSQGPGLLGEALAQERPEIERYVTTTGVGSEMSRFTLSTDEIHVPARGQFASKDFFVLFSYPLIAGDRNQVLDDKNAIVISESKAVTLFGSPEKSIGKPITWEVPGLKADVVVTGVFSDITSHSSTNFDFVLTFEYLKDILGDDLSWGNHQADHYVLLRKEVDPTEFGNQILDFIKTKNKESYVTLLMQPFSETYLHGKYENGQPSGGRIEYVRLFSVIAVFILVIACINFMNLSTAKASRRIKEVGIKKAVGAGRSTLIGHYLAESLIMTFLSMLVALLMADLLLGQFNMITGKHLKLTLTPGLLGALGSISLVTGIFAGSYPALYLSGFNPASVLKGKLNGSLGEVWARKGLVAFQFTLSIIFIVSVLVIYKQIQFIQSKNLGYDRSNIIHFNLGGELRKSKDALLSEIRNTPGVVKASAMWGSVAGQTGFTTGSFEWEGKDPDAIIQFEHFGVDHDLIEVLGIEMAAGRSFSAKYPGDTTKIILNETAINIMGLKDPVGKIFNLWGNDLEIIGVAKDFHFQSLHKNVNPFFLRLKPRETDKVMIKVAAGKETEVIEAMRSLYAKFNPGYVFDYAFLDSDYQKLYQSELRVATLSRYFAALAILISCLGLFGLAAFTAERRLKEIGIRKVLGSSTFGIVTLLSTEFIKIVLVSITIALPVSYLIAGIWLQEFAFRIDLEWWYFAAAGLMALGIAWLTIGSQAVKAANIDPVKCLKDE